jgi:hypothetical protein
MYPVFPTTYIPAATGLVVSLSRRHKGKKGYQPKRYVQLVGERKKK